MVSVAAELQSIAGRLEAQGFRMTPQREVTIRVLLENESDHLSAEDIFIKVKARKPAIGLATVYRTLELLADLHIVEKMNFGDGTARYDLRDEAASHMHHHLICRECGALQEIKEDWLHELEQRLEREYGFKVFDHRLEFIGSYGSDHGVCNGTCKAVS